MQRILVVDDEPNVRLVHRHVLSEKGYEVLEADSVRDALRVLNQEPVDLLVLDIKLRSESGLDVLQRVTKEFPNVAVVLCSAYVSFQNDYTSWLADSYVVKSSDPEELLKEIDRVLVKRGKSR